MIRICIAGAGAIGGFLGARLAAAGQAHVSALARGATLQALRETGWRLDQGGRRIVAPAVVSDDPGMLGQQDLVIIAVKGPALPVIAPTLGPLIGTDTVLLPAMNGVPWWFCRGIEPFGDAPLHSVDPEGVLARHLPFERTLGCVVYTSTSMPEPGLVQHQHGERFVIGEPFGRASPRVQRIVDVLAQAGFDGVASDDVRREIWFKLWGNMTMNPISAITGATTDRALADPLVREFISSVMIEAVAIGARIGCPIDQSPADRHKITARLGAFKTSMLQDVEAGRPLELDALLGAVHEIGERLDMQTPNIRALLGLARLFGRVHGLYPA